MSSESTGPVAPSKSARDENFPVGSWLLPAQLRPRVALFYAVVRGADDIADSPKLAPIVDSFTNLRRMRWIRVHQLPDYAFFNHSAHVQAGVGCVTCHGRIDQMEEVHQVQPLSMSWCLECHRDPALNLRPLDQVTNMTWLPPRDPEQHRIFAQQAMTERQIQPPEDCSGCHR